MDKSAYGYLTGSLLLALGVTLAHAAPPPKAKPAAAVASQPAAVAVSERLKAAFHEAGVAYPPKSASYLVFKKEKQVQVYATGADGEQHFIIAYPVEDVAGKLGPKLREGDLQVPEGIYGVVRLDPKSEFHRALLINYPNAYDRARAKEDGRKQLGGGIVFHGHTISLGCVAVSDRAVDDLYAIASATGSKNVKVIIAPEDFRKYLFQHWWGVPDGAPAWTGDLYSNIEETLSNYPS